MEFINEDIQRYAEAHSEQEPVLLSKINRDTHANVIMPRMLSGHIQGRILSMFSNMIRPSAILEIGTYTGYSALCMAEGLTENGQLITIDINEELEEKVRSFFSESALGSTIDYRIGDALEIIPQLENTFDLVFIDADKINYSNYYEMVLPKVRVGGFIIADNVLWSGKVLNTKQDKDTLALDEFNKHVHNDERVQNVLFPVRDGLMVLRKV
ncbi:MAG: O-methyltransferase [Bacteroidota bacterium]